MKNITPYIDEWKRRNKKINTKSVLHGTPIIIYTLIIENDKSIGLYSIQGRRILDTIEQNENDRTNDNEASKNKIHEYVGYFNSTYI